MKKFIAEFKEFALKGNMIDLAIGMIIATSFNAVVKSIVDDLMMPAFAFIFGKSDFSQLVAFAEYAEDGTLVGGIKYGMFIQNIVNFVIIALCLFIMVKVMNKLKNPKPVEEPEEEAPAPKPDDIVLLEEIRDLLAKEKVNQ
ncbi:MAG: large conductance mechanosensitive channel protein MscL [Clostridia bacterium]|nr:large conductance mechanosensitive channel protein MscL [Clostridia bacterium]